MRPGRVFSLWGGTPRLLTTYCLRFRSEWIHRGALGRGTQGKFCPRWSLESVLPLAFFMCLESCWRKKMKKVLSAERSLGCSDGEAMGMCSSASVYLAADYSFLFIYLFIFRFRAISQSCMLLLATSVLVGWREGRSSFPLQKHSSSVT